MILNNRNVQVEKTGSNTTVPDHPLSKLRYFLNCIISVVPDLNENGQLSTIINYQKPITLSWSEVDSLIQLCKVCFIALNNKCIFLAPQLCESGNQFYNIKQINNILAVSNSVVVGGKVQNVTKIMTYKEGWIERNFIDPIKELQARKKLQVVVKNDDCSIM